MSIDLDRANAHASRRRAKAEQEQQKRDRRMAERNARKASFWAEREAKRVLVAGFGKGWLR